MGPRGDAARSRDDHMRRSAAFTLIELLVVISIIALLIAILLPTLERVKRQVLVVRCSANLKSLALGSTAYAVEDAQGHFWVNDVTVWAGPVTVWAGAGAYLDANPDKESALRTFTDIICGGNRTVLWCPLVDDYVYSPVECSACAPGLQHPNWPLLWYDSRFGYEKFTMGYHRHGNLQGPSSMWLNSGNEDTTGPPKRPGSAQDVIMADEVNSQGPLGTAHGQFYQSTHIPGTNTPNPEVGLRERRENNVAYADGHVETHGQRGFIDSAGYLVWEGAHWVQYATAPWRIQY